MALFSSNRGYSSYHRAIALRSQNVSVPFQFPTFFIVSLFESSCDSLLIFIVFTSPLFSYARKADTQLHPTLPTQTSASPLASRAHKHHHQKTTTRNVAHHQNSQADLTPLTLSTNRTITIAIPRPTTSTRPVGRATKCQPQPQPATPPTPPKPNPHPNPPSHPARARAPS